jgi:signal transduction histidine kinase
MLPDWAGSIRFRLTALYSLFLFGLAALVVGGIYLGLNWRLHQHDVASSSYIVQQQPVPGGVIIRATEPATAQTVEHLANERALGLLRSYSFTSLGLLFLASLVVGWLVAGRVLRPIDRIAAVARDIQATDLSRRISLRGPPDELKDLADTFDAMLGRLDDAFQGQRRFIQETSHELRNPLAVIRTNLEVALSDPHADPVELRRTAELVHRTVERMGRIVDDLLANARESTFTRDIAPVDIDAVVADVTAEFAAPATARSLTLESSVEPNLRVLGDRVALRQALANLLANAVRLAPPGTRVRVGAGQQQDRVWIMVEDEGPGIRPEHRDLVFRRHWRGDESSGPDEGRSGLGLAIVRQIAEAHRGSVELAPSSSGGSIFTIWMPALGRASGPSIARPV